METTFIFFLEYYLLTCFFFSLMPLLSPCRVKIYGEGPGR